MSFQGFWSYVHLDDDAERGRIAELARDVISQYALETGEKIDLFLDRDDLNWGDAWRTKVDDTLASVAFFIPVLTARYFQSPECRRELNSFIRKATQLGFSELLMPILYVDVPALRTNEPDDELMRLVKPFHWEDWTTLRFADQTSGDYRQAVSKLAGKIATAIARSETVDIDRMSDGLDAAPTDDDDEPGQLDRFARAEDAMGEWAETLTLIGKEIETIGQVMQDSTPDIQGAKDSSKKRLIILRQMTSKLDAPARNINSFGQQFTSQLHDIDGGIRLIIEQAPLELEAGTVDLEQVCEFFSTLRDFAHSSADGLGSIQGMVDAIGPLEKMSREIRPVLRSLRRGLTLMIEGGEVIEAWVTMMDSSGVDCKAD